MGMGVLNKPRYERFAQELASGKTADEAYKLAGFTPNRGNASTLKAKQIVADRVAELLGERETMHSQATAKAVEAVGLTKGWIITKLVENAERALQAVQAKSADGAPAGEFKYEGSVANRALELLGKELGMFVDRKEIGQPGAFDGLEGDALRGRLADELVSLGMDDAAAALRPKGETEH